MTEKSYRFNTAKKSSNVELMTNPPINNFTKKALSDFIIKVLKNVLNEPKVFAVVTYSGSLFHKRCAAHRKKRAPQDFVNRVSVSILLFERNCLCY